MSPDKLCDGGRVGDIYIEETSVFYQNEVFSCIIKKIIIFLEDL